MTDANPEELLSYWFSPEVKPKWFQPDEAFDSELRTRFADWLAAAKNGALDDWRETASGTLALVVLMDQIPRNIYRGTPDAFATDSQALALSREAIAKGFDAQFTEEQRSFLYLPFMHSEDLATQDDGVSLYKTLGNAEALDYMQRHRDIIARFGRFPHRNAFLGRGSTEEEIEFLKQPGSSF
jgi:uncharacterized protein (DUF924 family)